MSSEAEEIKKRAKRIERSIKSLFGDKLMLRHYRSKRCQNIRERQKTLRKDPRLVYIVGRIDKLSKYQNKKHKKKVQQPPPPTTIKKLKALILKDINNPPLSQEDIDILFNQACNKKGMTLEDFRYWYNKQFNGIDLYLEQEKTREKAAKDAEDEKIKQRQIKETELREASRLAQMRRQSRNAYRGGKSPKPDKSKWISPEDKTTCPSVWCQMCNKYLTKTKKTVDIFYCPKCKYIYTKHRKCSRKQVLRKPHRLWLNSCCGNNMIQVGEVDFDNCRLSPSHITYDMPTFMNDK